jgi:hypothetical protein
VLEDLPNDAEIAARQGVRHDVDRPEFDAAAAERFRNSLYDAWNYIATEVAPWPKIRRPTRKSPHPRSTTRLTFSVFMSDSTRSM